MSMGLVALMVVLVFDGHDPRTRLHLSDIGRRCRHWRRSIAVATDLGASFDVSGCA
jgi:hypothetical protein